MSEPIIEAAARALRDKVGSVTFAGRSNLLPLSLDDLAETVLAAVTPLIEDAYARKLDAAEQIARKGNEYAKGWKLIEDDGSVITLGAGDAIIEAAAHLIAYSWDEATDNEREYSRETAARVVAAVTPLIRNATLEEAAQVAEDILLHPWQPATEHPLTAAIRALKEQP